MTFMPSSYLKAELTPEERPNVSDKCVFVGIDLAPNDMLETGVVAVDRDKAMLRMDKLSSDKQILLFLKSLGPPGSVVVALDVPKSLSIDGRWRQQEIKMFPLRLDNVPPKASANDEGDEDGDDDEDGPGFTNRCSERAWELYRKIREQGICVFLYFNHLAKPRYDLFIPFRTRTPRGCRALQAMIRNRLMLEQMPTNLAPSSVLDAMVGAYTAWLFYEGAYGEHYRLFWDHERSLMFEPLKRSL